MCDCKCLELLPEDDAHAFLIINGVFFTASRAQPEMFDGMAVRGRWVLPGKLSEAKKSPLAIIEIGRAFRMGAFQIHRFFSPLPDGFKHSSQG
jgi:hypothetical protein